MIKSQEATLHTWHCDMPGCAAIEESYSGDGTYSKTPKGWRRFHPVVSPTERNPAEADPGEEQFLVLCDLHAEYEKVVRLVLVALEKLGRPSPA